MALSYFFSLSPWKSESQLFCGGDGKGGGGGARQERKPREAQFQFIKSLLGNGCCISFFVFPGTDNLVRKYSVKAENGHLCKLCGQVKQAILLHLKDVHFHDGRNYSCPSCLTNHKTKNAFKKHIFSYHRDWKGININEFMTLPLT